MSNLDNSPPTISPTSPLITDKPKPKEKLGDIIGANYTEELIDNLFSRFCLGK